MKTLGYQNHLIRYRDSEVRRRGSGERGWSFTWEKKKKEESSLEGGGPFFVLVFLC